METLSWTAVVLWSHERQRVLVLPVTMWSSQRQRSSQIYNEKVSEVNEKMSILTRRMNFTHHLVCVTHRTNYIHRRLVIVLPRPPGKNHTRVCRSTSQCLLVIYFWPDLFIFCIVLVATQQISLKNIMNLVSVWLKYNKSQRLWDWHVVCCLKKYDSW